MLHLYLSRDRDQRHGIEIGSSEACNDVRRSRTGSGNTDARPSGRAGITVGGMNRPLLVHRQYVMQRCVIQCVIEGYFLPPRIAENCIDALLQ